MISVISHLSIISIVISTMLSYNEISITVSITLKYVILIRSPYIVISLNIFIMLQCNLLILPSC